jgi:hypothetical protein
MCVFLFDRYLVGYYLRPGGLKFWWTAAGRGREKKAEQARERSEYSAKACSAELDSYPG